MTLNLVWFILIVVLFSGFFLLEGFDYGVGTLMPFLDKREEKRTEVIMSIAPVWDGNEVWMITAGGALFAAFPHVYSTMFSTFYLALFLMLVALILRGVAFELRGHKTDGNWQRIWDAAICFGSAVPAILWGVAVTNLLRGLPIDANMVYQGGFLDLLSVYSIVGGLTFFFVFAFHGAAFLTLRLTDHDLLESARSLGVRMGLLAIIFFVVCLVLTYMETDLFLSTPAVIFMLITAVTFIVAWLRLRSGVAAGKSAFALSAVSIISVTVAFFLGLFPRLMVSSLNPEWSLTITNAASTPYTLHIMTIAVGCLVPVVLIYQAWSYWIFRKRITPEDAHKAH